jgi:hypothetical protein
LASQFGSSRFFIIAKIGLQNIVGQCVHFISIWGAIAERVWRCYGARELSLVGEAAIAPGHQDSVGKFKGYGAIVIEIASHRQVLCRVI